MASSESDVSVQMKIDYEDTTTEKISSIVIKLFNQSQGDDYVTIMDNPLLSSKEQLKKILLSGRLQFQDVTGFGSASIIGVKSFSVNNRTGIINVLLNESVYDFASIRFYVDDSGRLVYKPVFNE